MVSLAAPTAAPERGEEGWGVLVYFTVGLASVLVATTSLGLFLPDIVDDLDLSPAEQGWLGSSLLLANVVFSIPMNWWVSRFRPWRTAAVGFLAASGLIALAGGAPGFGVLLLARMGLGMVLQACQSPRNILIIQWISKRRFGLANGFSISIVDILMGTGTVLIPFMLGWLGGWRQTMFVWSGVVLAAAFLWMAMGKDKGRPELQGGGAEDNVTSIWSIFKYREVGFICLGMFGMLLARLAFGNFWPRFVGEEYGLDLRTAGVLMGIGTFAMAPAELGVVAIPFFLKTHYISPDGMWSGTGPCLHRPDIDRLVYPIGVALDIRRGDVQLLPDTNDEGVQPAWDHSEGGGSGIGDGVHSPVGGRGGRTNTGGIRRTEYRGPETGAIHQRVRAPSACSDSAPAGRIQTGKAGVGES